MSLRNQVPHLSWQSSQTLCLDPLGKPQPPAGAQEGHHSRGRAHPCLRPGCVLPLPPFTLVCSEMNFSSLVLRGISTPYLPWVPSSTRMKWEWLLSRHDRLPWFSSSSTYSAGKPPCKVQEETLWEKPGRGAPDSQSSQHVGTGMGQHVGPNSPRAHTVLTSALPHAPLALTPTRVLPGEAQNLLKTLGRVEGLLSKYQPGTVHGRVQGQAGWHLEQPGLMKGSLPVAGGGRR